MAVTFENNTQKALVRQLMDDVLENASDDLANNNYQGVYDYLQRSSTGYNYKILGKFDEILLDEMPDLLKTLTEIPEGMFCGSGITQITIPANIKKIGYSAFHDCKDLKLIIFEGTRLEWEALAKKSSGVSGAGSWYILGNGRTIQHDVVVNCADEQDIYHVSTKIEAVIDEAMTKREIVIKNQLVKLLKEQGFNTFGEYLKKFDVNLVSSADAGQPFVAAISPQRGIVFINPNLDQRDISVILRHEIGHQVLKHFDHLFAKLQKMGIESPSDLAHQLSNIAGDYEISNLIYDELDKKDAKHIIIENGEEFAALVTEFDFPEHPEYWTMNFDDLWDVLVKHYGYTKDQLEKKIQQDEQQGESGEDKKSDEYVAGWNDLMNKYKNGEISKEDIEDWINRVGQWR